MSTNIVDNKNALLFKDTALLMLFMRFMQFLLPWLLFSFQTLLKLHHNITRTVDQKPAMRFKRN